MFEDIPSDIGSSILTKGLDEAKEVFLPILKLLDSHKIQKLLFVSEVLVFGNDSFFFYRKMFRVSRVHDIQVFLKKWIRGLELSRIALIMRVHLENQKYLL